MSDIPEIDNDDLPTGTQSSARSSALLSRMVEIAAELPDPLAAWLTDAPTIEVINALTIGHQAIATTKALMPPMLTREMNRGMGAEATVGSAIRGQQGEQRVRDIIASAYADIECTAHEAKSGDLSLTLGLHKILIEVKNYTNAVPTAQVDKFHRDIDVSAARGALIISLFTRIRGIKDSFKLDYRAVGWGSIPCAYIVSNDPQHILTSIALVRHCIVQQDRFMPAPDTIEAALAGIRAEIEGLSKTRIDTATNTSALTTAIGQQLNQLVVHEQMLKRYILRACALATAADCDTGVPATIGAADTPLAIPAALVDIDRVRAGVAKNAILSPKGDLKLLRRELTPAILAECVAACGKKARVGVRFVIVEIDEITSAWIQKALY